MERSYPHVERNQWFNGHNYTLYLSPSIQAQLTPEQYENLKASMALVAEIETPMTPEQARELLRSIGR